MSTKRFLVMVDVDVTELRPDDDDAWRVVRHALWDAWDGSTAGLVTLHVCSITEPQGEPAA